MVCLVSVFLSMTAASPARTSITRRFVSTLMPSLANFFSAYWLMRASYVLRMWSALCTTVMLSLSPSLGYSRGMSSLRKSCSSAANSTPVGPPPTTSTDSMRRASASDTPGSDAVSSRSASLRRMDRASSTSFRNVACSYTPGVPKVLQGAPTATTRRSYGTVNSGLAAVMPLTSRHVTVRLAVSTDTAAASKNSAWPGAPGSKRRTGSIRERASTVPTVTPGSSGVLRK
mmetsp:Transcript_2233/g.4998  ORF Transcript_2233/g.4998 Transcript_2233/m.4998 type:complete len:230 (-) Transcript_2233:308-997(-)